MRIDGRPLRYGQSAFLIRFLLEGAGEAGRLGLHEFLRQAASGDGVAADDLPTLVGRPWERLSRDFERWLVVRQRRLEYGG